MSKLHLTFACGPYDRTLALRDGSVQPEGIDLNYIASQPPDIFWRMLQFKEFEISEMSLSNHATLVSTGDAPFIAIPVFPSRRSRSPMRPSRPPRPAQPSPISMFATPRQARARAIPSSFGRSWNGCAPATPTW